jgi:HlyD family secretion protein
MAQHKHPLLVYAAIAAVAAVVLIWRLAQPAPPGVEVEIVAAGKVQSTVANTKAGTIEACRRAGISPRLGGQIDRMPVKEGDVVEQGQILMEFWNEDLQAHEQLAASELRATEARWEQACIVSERARREAERIRRLRDSNLASEESVDSAESDALAQQAACSAALSAVDVSRARLDVARAALDQTRLRAPFPGVVAEVNGEVGEFVTPSPVGIPTPPAVDLMDMSCLYVSAPIDEVDAPGIAVGMNAHIALDAFPDEQFSGRVRRVAPYVLDLEKQARTVDVEVEFVNSEECSRMLPGYSADIEVILDERVDVLRIPTEALREGGRVYVVNEDNAVEDRAITTGLRNWVWTEVRSGLEAGDRIIVNIDREGVEAGAVIRPVLPTPADD